MRFPTMWYVQPAKHQVSHLLLSAIKCHSYSCMPPGVTLQAVCHKVSHLMSAMKCHSCNCLPLSDPRSCHQVPPSTLCNQMSHLLFSAFKCHFHSCCRPFSVTLAAVCHQVSQLLLSAIKCHSCSHLLPRVTFAAVCR